MEEVKGNVKDMWKILKEIINKTKGSRFSCSEFKNNNQIVNEPTEISNLFNSFYVNVGPSLAGKISTVPGDVQMYMKGEYACSMFLTPVTPYEIEIVISKQKSNKACGYDGVFINVVKKIGHVISEPLAIIFNKSFMQGVFPDLLKLAKVIPIYKSGDVDVFTNYRPVSLLPVFSKILERLFYKRLINYVNNCEILNHSQYGFREKVQLCML